MIMPFGKNKLNGMPIVWDTGNVVNPHILIVGSSGVGKTYQLRRMLSLLSQQGIRLHVFDSHGDIVTSPQVSTSVEFAECSEFGVNPFKINPDPYFGGVRRKVNSFISMLERYGRVLGDKQKPVLRALLYDLYAAYGYDGNDRSTWDSKGKDIPTMSDLLDYVNFKLKSLIVGNSEDVMDAISSLSKHVSKMDKLQAMGADDELLSTLRSKCKETFIRFIDTMQTGRELDDYIKYDSKDVLKSVAMRIDTLNATGIFKDRAPMFDLNKPIWRYDIHSLTDEEKGFIVELYLEKIFLTAKQGGVKKHIDTMVFIDEAHKFISKEQDHIINLISKEIRKYGVGVVFASQQFKDFTDDVISNCATKVILGIDVMYMESLSRKLAIKPARLKFITPKKSALIQINNSDNKLSGVFIDTTLSTT